MQEPVVLLPGMMCDARLFIPQIEALSSLHSIMVAPLTAGSTMHKLAKSVLDQTPEHFALAGLSMGGIVAMEIIRQAPERVTRLALLDTNPLPETPERQELRAPQMERVKAGALRAVMRDEMKPNYLADGPNTSAILDLCMAMAEALGPQVFCHQSLALRDRPDQCETLRHFSKPTLILCGEDDLLCPVQRHEFMYDLMPHAKLSLIQNAGHLPTLEQPDLVNKELAAWLALPGQG